MGMGAVSGARCSMQRCGIERKAAASWLRSDTSPALGTALGAALGTALAGGSDGGRVAGAAAAPTATTVEAR
jgi:hypothetical protein